MRDLAVLLVTYGSLPFIPFFPFFGLLVYSWLAYMRPQDLGWGVASDHRLSLYVALAIVVGIALRHRRERALTFAPQTIALILFIAWIGVTQWQAVLPEAGREVFGNYWKAVLVAVLTTGLVRDRSRFRLAMLVIAGSLGLLGLKYALFGLVRGGTQFKEGPGGFMNDNNGFASALAMALPLLAAAATAGERRWIRIGAAVLAAGSVLTILFTFSRGGFLTLCGVAALMLLRTRRRGLAAATVALGLVAFLVATRDTTREAYRDRLATITEYEGDESAMGRIRAWGVSLEVFRDYPILGVGPNNFMTVYRRYGNPDDVRVAHNSYLQVLAENGAPGLALFLALLAVALWRLERVRRRTADPWIANWASMIQISLLGFMAASLTLNRAYFDLMYHLVGLSVSLELVAADAPVQAAAAPEAEIPWWRRPEPQEA